MTLPVDNVSVRQAVEGFALDFLIYTAPPRLAPILRSDTQLQILGATYLEPERHFTIPEIVERSGRPQPAVAREVDRLVAAGLLDTELRSGRRSVGQSPRR